MEDMRKKLLSLPPNYVSLQELQERRLLKKQKEKEEEERRMEKERLREEKEKLQKKSEEERKLRESHKTLEIKNKTSIDRSNRRNYQRSKKKHRQIKEEINLDYPKQESEIVVAAAAEIPNPEQRLEEPTKKKKKKERFKKNKTSLKPKVEEILNGDPKELPPSETDREKAILVVPPENGEEKKEMRSRFRSKRKKPLPKTGGVSMSQTVEIAGRIGSLTIDDGDMTKLEANGERGVNDNRSAVNVNGGRWEFNSGPRRSGGQRQWRDSNMMWVRRGSNMMWIRRDSHLVWVRKDDNVDGIPNGSGKYYYV